MNVELMNEFNEEMGTGIRLTAESLVCSSCYNHGRQLGSQKDLVSVIDDLKDIIKEQETLSENSFAGDMHVYAASKMVSYTGEYILEEGALLLSEDRLTFQHSLSSPFPLGLLAMKTSLPSVLAHSQPSVPGQKLPKFTLNP